MASIFPPYDTLKIGVCWLDGKGSVTFQNRACQKLCGEQSGICKTQIFTICQSIQSRRTLPDGLHCFSGITVKDKYFDVGVIKSGETTGVYIHEVTDAIEQELKLLPQDLLTARQREIVRLKVLGKSNPEICHQLKISVNTLKTHLKNIYAALPPGKYHLLSSERTRSER